MDKSPPWTSSGTTPLDGSTPTHHSVSTQRELRPRKRLLQRRVRPSYPPPPPAQTDDQLLKDTFHLFQSPTKSTPFQSTIHKSTPFQTPFQTPATNNLFAGFHTPGTSKPPGSIYRQPSFTQPRFNTDLKGALPDLASPIDGGMDTESEAPTPDQLAYEARRRGYTTTPSRTTGRGEIPRGRNTESRVDKVKRLNSRNRRSKDLDRHYDSDDRGSDDDDSNQPRRRVQQRVETQVYEQGWVKNHEHIPQILLSYTGVFIRIFLGLLLLWCLFTITMTVRQDIHQKIDEYSSHAARVVSQCAFDHLQNRCSPDMMAPALRVQCDEWERCMNRDPKKITWTKVGAETAAEVANSFFNNISAKTMVRSPAPSTL